ncbi:MAG: hypothetical protein HYX57_04640 [Chloroflexi bacterium]|nr:hypothetical protein [Chloroflexota bacterium]
MTTDPDALLEAVETMIAGLDGTASSEVAGGMEWHRDGRPFATLDGSRVVVRVGAAIAAAAIRTPDTMPGDPGPDWVAFEPAALDEHALDRLEAWLTAAWRRAAPGR